MTLLVSLGRKNKTVLKAGDRQIPKIGHDVKFFNKKA